MEKYYLKSVIKLFIDKLAYLKYCKIIIVVVIDEKINS